MENKNKQELLEDLKKIVDKYDNLKVVIDKMLNELDDLEKDYYKIVELIKNK